MAVTCVPEGTSPWPTTQTRLLTSRVSEVANVAVPTYILPIAPCELLTAVPAPAAVWTITSWKEAVAGVAVRASPTPVSVRVPSSKDVALVDPESLAAVILTFCKPRILTPPRACATVDKFWRGTAVW